MQNLVTAFAHLRSPLQSDSAIRAAVTFALTQRFAHSLVLLPAAAHGGGGLPKYHVSVEMNCLRQSSHITVIRRGETGRGPYVGEFERVAGRMRGA
ncbi:hypothetical protein PHLGIDRAFT_121445 [Phlebiopsis gigantea 11061_1 CR5-6]|uniref:Uncharacterized protein n=1 Tax=Phlebiopsis gigantea (strain 11061_1 CR5-6) TaxID=745531 RepID=A0A0C3PDY6_PHLG1|nr:hypothetical protein PHLGIDRAFT_121445 [Phlebiopsis gigantea 11061_1 CR5-6]